MSIAVSIPIIWQTAPNPLSKQPAIIWHHHRHHRPAPPLHHQLHINPECESPLFIHCDSSTPHIARRSSKNRTIWDYHQRKMNSVCFAAPLSNTMNTKIQQSSSPASLWRPWLVTRKDAQIECRKTKLACPYSRPEVPSNTTTDGKMQSFQHPVRLYWPRSKSFDYLFSDGESLLRNFPVQATINFYDESDSEEEEEDSCDEDDDSEDEECLKLNSHFTSYN
ncbi:protein ripply1 [Pimephales promelas]|uniref:protein ripply1 n=1 Tax=Pimephales promelas TaxID=90988 RepID=UPI00195587FA|nr:protein ripply1 [Pimephales promelas]KAG1970078.1 protein ripply1 [Pimephales promelas]